MPEDIESNKAIGEQMYLFAQQLYPIHRAITGAGVRQTLDEIARRIPLQQHSVPTGTPVLDWIVPDEWKVRDGFISDMNGYRIIDYRRSNLHIPSYSVAVDQKMRLSELIPNLHTLPEHPDWIPFRAFHFQKKWGFCLSQHDLEKLKRSSVDSDPLFQVRIDAEQKPGHLNYGELCIPGQTTDEFLISTHVCHPSLANDNLSGIVVATELARRLLRDAPLPISFRFLFIPCTIGSITWLAQHKDNMPPIRGGLVLSNLGDEGIFNYKDSRRSSGHSNPLINRVAAEVMSQNSLLWQQRPFNPWGYDERQYCSPGFNLPMGRLTRSSDGEFPEYHTSADNLSFIKPAALAESLELAWKIVSAFVDQLKPSSADALNADDETDSQNSAFNPLQPFEDSWKDFAKRRWINLKPFGEPRLGQYGMYQGYGAQDNQQLQRAVLWMLNLSDGSHTFSEIVIQSQQNPQWLMTAAERLTQCGLLNELNEP